MIYNFNNQVAFITGGGAGFGKAFAKELASRGAAVVLADINMDAAKAAAEDLSGQGYQALAVQCDVADRAEVEKAVDIAVETYGGINILINNAGLHLTHYNEPFIKMTEADLKALFNVNVIGVVNCSVACYQALAEREGRIVNISSMAGHMSSTPYGVSKLAVRGVTIALAQQFSLAGIRVNAISPGLIDTESAVEDLHDDIKKMVIDQMQLIHRQGRIKDIINALLFLLSDQSSFITGETIKITGGYPLSI